MEKENRAIVPDRGKSHRIKGGHNYSCSAALEECRGTTVGGQASVKHNALLFAVNAI